MREYDQDCQENKADSYGEMNRITDFGAKDGPEGTHDECDEQHQACHTNVDGMKQS
jgi:hypothetical protein